ASILYNEELGAVLQVQESHAETIEAELAAALPDCVHTIGAPLAEDIVSIHYAGAEVFAQSRTSLHRLWSETTYQMQKLRDNPVCAQQEYHRILDRNDNGLHAVLTFDPNHDIAAPYIATGKRPKMAILREQGVNGQLEMAAAFDRAGFEAHDVHMSDIISGRVSLEEFSGFVACGGFSYGDVLGAGEGWAKSILFNSRARDEFSRFFERGDSFALGVCNGCQMMSNLH